MARLTVRQRRRGTIVPIVAVALIGLFGFTALAIDLGLICVARTQCQNAADAAAMAGARTLNGDAAAANNAAQAVVNAVNTATTNTVLSQPLAASAVTIQIGSYTYDQSSQSFPTPPFTGLVTVAPGGSPGPNPTDNWSLVQATVNYQGNYMFARVFGLTGYNTSTTAVAAHRPRDLSIILDFSGSMRFGSLMGAPYSGTRDITGGGNTENSGSNNPEAIYPLFGQYSDTVKAGLQNTKKLNLGGQQYDVANVTVTTSDGRPPVVSDFQTKSGGGPAFTSAGADGDQNYAASQPGDARLRVNNKAGNAYAKTATEVLGSASPSASFESLGYNFLTGQTFNGFTQGPNYWGKTFYIWPPDPTNDWRSKYFGTNDTTKLWDSKGNWKSPASGPYTINYKAILSWLKNTGPNPFPSTLRSGKIVYYTAIPDDIDTSVFPPDDLNQRFWKDYIDYCLGLVQTGKSSWLVTTGADSASGNTLGLTGYGGDFTWGKVKVSAKPGGQYMDYDDNPKRPRTHFWFGPMTMVDFLGCYNLWYDVSPECSRFCWWPGTCHESPLYACKLGVRAALDDINNNHPTDYVSLIMFSEPRSSATDTGTRFNRVRVPLGRDYQRMQQSLWYPLAAIENPGSTINPYDYDNNLEVPRAMGGTCFPMPLMLAYNQFSSNSSLRNYNPSPAPDGDAGGLGRKGAQKIVILETDGLPNITATASFTNNGAYESYYNVRYNSSKPSAGEFPTVKSVGDNNPAVTSQIYDICKTICAQESASPPGFATTRKPVLIHTIGFGPAYDASSPSRGAALSTLQQIQTIGGTQTSSSDPLQSYKIINGTEAEMAANLQQAFRIILQGGIQVSLLQ